MDPLARLVAARSSSAGGAVPAVYDDEAPTTSSAPVELPRDGSAARWVRRSLLGAREGAQTWWLRGQKEAAARAPLSLSDSTPCATPSITHTANRRARRF